MNIYRFRLIFLIVMMTGLSVLSAACRREQPQLDPIEIQVTSITIQGSSHVSIGAAVTYSAVLLPHNATNLSVTWSVFSRGGVAEINQQGILSPSQAGGITIRATAANGLYAEIQVAILNVTIPVTSVEIHGSNQFVHGDREDYSLTVLPENATWRQVEWSVISGQGRIDASGRLAAKASGELVIQVRVDGIPATKTIQVTPYTGPVSSLRVLLNRVDLRHTVLRDYEREFEAIHPMYDVTFETLLDYENNARMRLMGGNYGDVLLMPSSVSAQNLSYYFAPIGTLDSLSSSWRYVGQKAYQDTVYGLPTYGNVNGILYNKKVFERASITMLPTTPEAFLDAMRSIRTHHANHPDFIAPFYSNKKDGWPLDQWQGNVSGVSGNPDYYYNILPTDRQAFLPGSPHHIVYKLLYDLVYEGLIEADPSTTNWERSKIEFVKGNIGTMVVGSWAVSQFIDVATRVKEGTFVFDDGTPGEQSNLADPEDIGYMPFPYTHPDGHLYSAHSPDFFMGISNRSNNIQGANDFMMWFLRESGYYELTGGIPPRTDMPFPDVIAAFEALGVILFEENPPTGAMIGRLELVEASSGIVLWNPDWKRDLFEDAFFRRKTFETISSNLNTLWNSGIDQTA